MNIIIPQLLINRVLSKLINENLEQFLMNLFCNKSLIKMDLTYREIRRKFFKIIEYAYLKLINIIPITEFKYLQKMEICK